ncbi:response regulator [Yoonia sp. 208BN28-4]|uniref:response regulator n=1 Tax=Yoonia sp. 208BN28-4 TaxID=3126505 RepID=UPI0030B7A9CD
MFDDLKILYLEDEIIVAMETTAHLESLGFDTVAVAYKLSKAQDAVAQEDFDIALLDINVGRGETSVALGEALAEKGTRVVFASGNSSAARDLRGRGFAFLDKPFSHSALTQELEAALEPSETE